MSLSATLANALSGLNVAQQALGVTANNVANANTPGYSRKVLNQETVVVSDRGAGARATDVARLTDEFLVEEIRRQSSVAGQSAAVQRYQDLLQLAFGAPGDNRDLAVQLGALQVALDALATSPETSATALQLLSAIDEVARTLGGLADQVQVLRGDADQEIGRTVAAINGEIQAVHDLNTEIKRLAQLGQINPELLDRRDALIQSLAEKIDIRTYTQDSGALAIYTAAARPCSIRRPGSWSTTANLVTSDTAFDLIAVFRENQLDPATGQPLDPTAGVPLVSGGVRAELTPELQNDATPDADQQITSRIRGGRLAGLLEIRDRTLPDLDDQLQELAGALRFALNAAHNDASPVPPPAQLSGSRTDLSAFAGAARSGSATFAVVDTSDGSTLLAFQIDVAAAADESALAAQIDAALGAFGSASIGADGNLEIALAAGGQGIAVAEGDSTITITDAAGGARDYGLAHYFGLNDLLVGDGSRPSDFAVRADLASAPAPDRHRAPRRRRRPAAGGDAGRGGRQSRRPGAGGRPRRGAAAARPRWARGARGHACRLRRRHHRPQRGAGAERRADRRSRPGARRPAGVPRGGGLGGQSRRGDGAHGPAAAGLYRRRAAGRGDRGAVRRAARNREVGAGPC